MIYSNLVSVDKWKFRSLDGIYHLEHYLYLSLISNEEHLDQYSALLNCYVLNPNS